MRRIFYLLIFISSFYRANSQTLSSPTFYGNANTSANLSFGMGEAIVGNLPASGASLFMGGQTPSIQSVYTTVADGDWNTPGTWDLGLPPSGADVVIAHQVTVTGVVASMPNSMLVNTGASVTISASGVLHAKGILNNGTIQTTGTGGAQLAIHGSSFTNNGALIANSTGNNPNVSNPGYGTIYGYITTLDPSPTITNNGTMSIGGGSYLSFVQTNTTFINNSAINNNGSFSIGAWSTTCTWNNNAGSTYSGSGTVNFGEYGTGSTCTYTSASTFTFSNLILSNYQYDLQSQINIANNGEVHVAQTSFSAGSTSLGYGSNVKLYYEENAAVNRSKEWDETSGLGVPAEVYTQSQINMGYNSTSSPLTLSKLLVFSNGQILMNEAGYQRTAPLIVTSQLYVEGSLKLSSQSGGGLEVGGSFDFTATGTLISNNNTVKFNGSSDQTINYANSPLSLGAVIINKAAGSSIYLGTNLNLTGAAINVLDFQTTTSINLQGHDILIIGASASVALGSNNGTFTSTSSCGVIFGAGTYTISGTGNLNFSGSAELRTGTSNGSIDFGAGNVFISSKLVINAPNFSFTSHCHYQSGSTLVYSHSGNRTIGTEWKDDGQTGGQPYNVALAGTATTINYTSGDKQVENNLTIANGCTFSTDQKIMVKGDVTLQTTGSLTLTSSGILEMNGSNSATQYLSKVGATLSLNRLEIENNNTVKLQSSLTLTAASGILLDYESGGTLDLNGYNLTFANTGVGSISTISSASKIVSSNTLSDPSNNVYLNGPTSFTGTGFVTFSSVSVLDVKLTASATYDFSTSKAIFGTNSFLTIENASAVIAGNPKYNTGSVLAYRYVGSRLIGNEWANVCTVADNIPSRVDLYGATTQVLMPNTNGCYQIGASGLQIYQGTLSFDNSASQDLQIAGNCWSTSAGNINSYANSNLVFNGTTNQTIDLDFATTLNKLTIATTGAAKVSLAKSLTVKTIEFASGDLDLNGSNNIQLQTDAGSIINESDATGNIVNSVTPTVGNGYVGRITTTNIPATATNVGSLGLTLTLNSGGPSGQYTVKRFPLSVSSVGANAAGSIRRTFKIAVTNNCLVDVSFSYFESEANGINDGTTPLYIYNSSSQTTGYSLSFPIANQTSNNTGNIIQVSGLSLASTGVWLTASNDGVPTIVSTAAGGNWDVGSTWIGGVSPKDVSSANVVINGPVTINQSYNNTSQTVGSLTINSGKTLSISSGGSISIGGTSTNNGTLQISGAGVLHLLNGSTFSNTGTLSCSSGSLVEFDGSSTFNGTASFYDLTLNGSVTFSNAPTIANNLNLKSNAQLLGQAPNYSVGSNLIYALGTTVNRGLEWSATTGAGYPYNVIIKDGTILNFSAGNASLNTAIANKLTIIAGAASDSKLDMNTAADVYQAVLTVKHLELQRSATNHAFINLPNYAGAKLVIKDGNLTMPSTYDNTLEINNSGVNCTMEFFSTSTVQYIDGYLVSDNGTIIFNNSFGYIKSNSGATILAGNGTSGSYTKIKFSTQKGTDGISFTSTPWGQFTIDLAGGDRKIRNGSLYSHGYQSTVSSTASGTLTLESPMGSSIGNNYYGGWDFGTNNVVVDSATLYINGTEPRTGYPNYTSNSTLYYSLGASPGSEWQQGNGSGSPYNVYVNFISGVHPNFTIPTGNYYIKKDLTYDVSGTPSIIALCGASSNVYLAGNINYGNYGRFSMPGTLVLNGVSNQSVKIEADVENLTLNKSLGNAQLTSDLTINGTLNFTAGNLDLNGAHIITLGSAASITNETLTKRIINSSFNMNGYVETTRNYSNASAETFGGLGLSLTSTGAATLLVRRIPGYTGLVASGRQGYDNLFAVKSLGGVFTDNISINYSNFGSNGNTALSNLVWTSLTGSNLSFNSQITTDAANTVSASIPFISAGFTYVSVANIATVGVTKTTILDNGVWSNPNHWTPVGVPQAGDVIIVNNTNFHADMNLSQGDVLGSLTINGGKSLILDASKDIYFSGTVTINSSAALTLNSSSSFHTLGGTIINNNGSINAASTSNFDCHDATTMSGQNTTFGSLRIGGAFTANNQISISDTLRFYSQGTWVSSVKKPTYNVGSTLEYSQGGVVNRGNEWSATSGNGYPYNVRIISNTELNVAGANPSIAKSIAGSLLVTSGLFDMSATSGTAMTSNITIWGNVFIASDGKVYLSNQSSSKFIVNGNFTHNGITTEFKAPQGSTLEFAGTLATQTISSSTLIYVDGSLRMNNTANPVIINTGVLMTGDNAKLVLVSSKGIYLTNGTSIDLQDGADLQALTNATIDGSAPNAALDPTSNINIYSNTSGYTFDYLPNASTYYTTTINNVYLSVSVGASSSFNANFGSGKLTINSGILITSNTTGNLITSGYPVYGLNSQLLISSANITAANFTNSCSYWNTGNGAGSPYNLYLDNTDIVLPSSNYYVRGNLSLEEVLVGGASTLTFGTSTNLYLAGNLDGGNTGAIDIGSGTLTFNGTSNQMIACDSTSTTITNITINKSAGDLQLSNTLTVSGNLTLTAGKLDLKSSNLKLLSTANLVGESFAKRVYSSLSTSSSYISFSTNFGGATSITTSNNGGIGFTATTNDPAGFTNTVIKRYFKGIANVGFSNSINKYYSLTCADGIIPVRAGISYFSDELNGNIASTSMKMYRSDNMTSGANYLPISGTTNTFGVVPAKYTTSESSFNVMPAVTTYFTAANSDAAYAGSYTIGTGAFASNTLQDVIGLLNTSGIGTGGATINLPPGYTFTLDSALTFNFGANEPSATNPLIITGDSLNPAIVYAPLGGTNDRDAFVRVLGTDYLTIQHINFVDPTSNTNQTSTMEWGIALLKSGPGNGIRNNTIRNCHVTMRKLNSIATGIYVGNHGVNPNSTYTPTSASGTNSNNSIYSNLIQDVNTGIYINGYDDPFNLLQDDNWRIGDTTNVTLGNQIFNFGGDTSVPAYGIRARNTNQILVGNNIINNTTNGGAAHTNLLTGIEVNGSSSASSYFVHNDISLTQGANAFNTYALVGNMSGSQTLFVDRNNIHDNEMTAGSTGNFYGIYSSTPPTNLRIRNNRVSHNTNLNTTGSFCGIYNLGGGAVNITGNDIDTNITTSNSDCYGIYNNTSGNVNCLSNNIREYEQNGTVGNFYGYCNDNTVVSAFQAAPVENINFNNFSGFTAGGAINIFGIVTSQSIVASKNTNVNLLRKYTANLGNITGLYIRRGATIQGVNNSVRNYKAKGDILGIRITDGATVTLSNDSIADFVQQLNGNTYGINSTIASTYAASSSRIINGNNIDNFINPVGGSGATMGILHTSSGSGGPHIVTSNSNRVSNITGNGSGSTLGILHTSSGSGGPHIVSATSNTVINISGNGGGSTSGILHTSSGSGGPHTITTTSNTIQNISGTGSGSTHGILHTSSGSGGPHTFSTTSNTIQNISGTGSGSTHGILHTSSGSGGPHVIQTNGNVISAISNTGSGDTYGILHTSSGSGGSQSLSRVGNTISNISNNGSGNTYGILHTSSGSGGPHIYTSSNNNINNVNNGTIGTGSTYGILHTSSGSGGPHRERIGNNVVTNLSSNSDSAIGIKILHADSVNIEKNVVGKVRAKGSNTAAGLILDHNTTNTIGIIKNNVIGDLHTTTASASDDLVGVDLRGAAGSNLKLYFNTIYLNDSNNTSGYSSSAFRVDNGTTLDMRNNIIINNSTKSGGATVIKRSGVGANIAATSDYNLYYVNDSTTNFIFDDGVSTIQSFTAYKALALAQNNREKNNVQENVQFVSLNPNSSSYLDIDPTIPTKAESGGSATNLGVTTDKAGNIRFGSLGYIGTGSASDIGAYEKNYIPLYHTWVGDFSSEWSNALNWSANYLPTSSDSVIIPRVIAPYFQPSLTSADAVVGKVTTKGAVAGPTITINAGRKLSVLGDLLANSATTFTGSGKLELAGTSTQSISGIHTISNIDMNNSSGVVIQSSGTTMNINGRLALVSGNLVTNNNLNLKSTTTSTGYISGIGSGSISGQVNVERRITGNTGYHYIGSAVNGVSVIPAWNDDFGVIGADNFAYNPSLPLTSSYSVWEYNETNNTPNMNYGWVSATSASDVLFPGKGFSAYITTGTTVDVKGTVNHGAYSSSPNFSLTNTNSGNVYADGFNLIANPYPSPITWSGLKSITNSGSAKLFGAMHIWITSGPFANTYGTHNGLIGTNGITNTIPAEQGFFVQDSIPGPLLADNTIRIDNANPTFYDDLVLPNSMFITLEKDSLKDQSTLAFYNGATENFDSQFDAVKFLGYNSPNALIYTKGLNGFNYGLNFMPDFNSSYVVPIGIEPKGQGNYTLSLENLSSFDATTQVYLEDAFTGVWQDMKADNSYTVNMGNADCNNRFFIHFTGNAITDITKVEQEEAAYSGIYCNGTTVFVNYYGSNQHATPADLTVYDNLGRIIQSQALVLSKGSQQFDLPSDFAKGSYIVKLRIKDQVYTSRTLIK